MSIATALFNFPVATFGVVVLRIFSADVAVASQDFSQSIGVSRSSEAETKTSYEARGTFVKQGLDGVFGLSGFSYGLSIGVDQFLIRGPSQTEYYAEHFPSGRRNQNKASLATNYTFKRTFDLKLSGQLTSDSISESRSASVGVASWWFGETLQTSLDLTRSVSDRPESSRLDLDGETVRLAPVSSSTGATVSLRHLTSATQMTLMSFSRIVSEERPFLDIYTFEFRQYLTQLNAAIHGAYSRMINTGDIDPVTDYGSMTGHQFEVSFLKKVFESGQWKASYRFVREDEHKRATGDHLVYGADQYSSSYVHNLKAGVLTAYPTSLQLGASRYLSNAGFSSVGGEAGMKVRF